MPQTAVAEHGELLLHAVPTHARTHARTHAMQYCCNKYAKKLEITAVPQGWPLQMRRPHLWGTVCRQGLSTALCPLHTALQTSAQCNDQSRRRSLLQVKDCAAPSVHLEQCRCMRRSLQCQWSTARQAICLGSLWIPNLQEPRWHVNRNRIVELTNSVSLNRAASVPR